MADDPRGVLQQVAAFGYKQIESFEGAQGIFWGMSNTEFKQMMDDLGMQMISAHADVFTDVERKIEELAEIGADYIICPRIGPQESLDEFRRIADRFNGIGEMARNAGLRFAYHNHDYSFDLQEGEQPQRVMMDRTDPELVDFEMDFYWVVYAGEDPASWIREYPNRFTAGHVKDYPGGENPGFTILGTGTIDFPSLLPIAVENGMEYLIVEQDEHPGTTSLDAAEQDAGYMKNLNR